MIDYSHRANKSVYVEWISIFEQQESNSFDVRWMFITFRVLRSIKVD